MYAILLIQLASTIIGDSKSFHPFLHVSAFCSTPLGQCYSPLRRISCQNEREGLFLNTNDEPPSDPPLLDEFATPKNYSQRRIATTTREARPRSIRVERMPRLPVWPVWAGVVDFLVGWILGPEQGSKLEQYVLGGRVCPMQLDGITTSPFLLLVHHHHNFWKWDAIFRKLSALVLPEGFPAHPHRGFTTLTYFLPNTKTNRNNKKATGGGGGGFVHRDSIGVKQTYGTKGSYQHQAQWLFTGRGMLHEEMFDLVQNDLGSNNQNYNSRYELYQLWVNVPGNHKLDPPQVQLLKECEDTDGSGKDGMPLVTTQKTVFDDASNESSWITTTCDVRVIAGTYKPYEDRNGKQEEEFKSGTAPLHSDMSILHVTIEDTASKSGSSASDGRINKEGNPMKRGWTYEIPPGHDTLIVYVRMGSCTMSTCTVSPDNGSILTSSPTNVPIHSTVFVEPDIPGSSSSRTKERLVIIPNNLDDPVDLLVLSGRPLYEPDGQTIEQVSMQGSMVMNNNAQIQQAYQDYQYGQMGQPWDHTLPDEEWMEHVRQTKPRF